MVGGVSAGAAGVASVMTAKVTLAMILQSREFQRRVRLAYLFSRYPIVSQTFCDTEMLALERLGFALELYSIYPPPTSFRHGHARRLKASLHYAPPAPVLKLAEAAAKAEGRWPSALIAEHERKYGPAYKAALRARNALWFAELFTRRGITHFHVHFANRAAHTAIFIKALSGIPFSVSTHGQDFMSDLGSDELLREICREAEFVANETHFSKGLVAKVCPQSEGKMHRVFNGMDLANFPAPAPRPEAPDRPVSIVSTGRLIEFKGFQHLIPACATLHARGLNFRCDIIGDGPGRESLQGQIEGLGLRAQVRLRGSLPQEEVFAALRACDIFTLPCTTDRLGTTDVFPTVILEAMASGKPVVSTRLAGVPEQIVDEESGLLVEPGNEVQLADALAALVTSGPRRQELGQAGRLRVEQEFSVEKTVLPLKALFERHVKSTAPAPAAQARLGVLVSEWPGHESTTRELKQLHAAHPALRIYAIDSASAAPGLPQAMYLENLDFLPDGMVTEGEWQQEREVARRMETWRMDLGQKLSSETFLRHARRALYLRRMVAESGVRHLHIGDARELLTGWLLHRLSGTTISLSLDTRPPRTSDSVLAKLASACLGIRCSLADGEWAPIKAELGRDTAVVRCKVTRPPETEWMESLASWAGK